MSDTDNTNDSAAMPPASAGSQPVAWALTWEEDGHRIDPEWVYTSRDEAAETNETGCYGRATVVPLYRHLQPTLTDAEREAIEYLMLGGTEGPADVERAMLDIARNLLERTK